MFDFAWSEIVLIGVVALIAIGPKDLPVAMKAVAGMVKKARRMAGEFQTHVDEMVREADLDDVRKQFNEIRNFDVKGTIERAVDQDGTLRQTFADNPLAPASNWVPPSEAKPLDGLAGGATPDGPAPTETDAPAFIPPEYARKPEPPPDFIPPGTLPPWSARSSRLRT